MSSLTDRLKAASGATDAPAPAPAGPTGDLAGTLRNANTNSTVAPPPPPPAGPDPNAYQPPSWLPGAGMMHKISDLFDNAFTAGGANYATAKAGDLARGYGIQNTTPDVATLRATTEQNRQDVGPVASTAADIAGYTMGPGKLLGPLAGKAAPYIGRYGAAALEGGLGSTAYSVGQGETDPWKIAKNAALPMAGGIAGQAIGDLTAPLIRRISDYVRDLPGRAGDTAFKDWRQRAGKEDISPEISDFKVIYPSGSPANQALSQAQKAAAQPIEPGWGAEAVKKGLTAAATGLGVHTFGLPGIATIAPAEAAGKYIVDPIARRLNAWGRSSAVNQALDQAWPQVFNRGPLTTDVQPWTRALRQLGIGGTLDQPQ